ncbi:MAG: rhodanese-related sulfurtransferase [Bacteroidota bacterium]
MPLYNTLDQEALRERVAKEAFDRITLSFYRYVRLTDVETLRDRMFADWERLGILGRIYLAQEGVNAQISIPRPHFDAFLAWMEANEAFQAMDLKIAVEDDRFSFIKLKVKVRHKIVADGLDDRSFDVTDVGRHLSAQEWNDAMNLPETVVVDMRNVYESEVGHFKGAILPRAVTFREELDEVLGLLQDKKDKKILLYCTGGVRCEKASAYFRHHGFEDVNQLNGGIIYYAQQVKEQGMTSEFIGKNFVFDDRMGERITDDVISECHQCGAACDNHTNCINQACHVLFIQCKECAEIMNACCSEECKHIISLSEEEQAHIRKTNPLKDVQALYHPVIKRIR